MLIATALLAATLSTPICTDVPPRLHLTDGARANREALYKQGIPFREFLAAADERRQLWLDNYAHGVVPDALLQRARAVGGSWRILAVAVDGCSDSVNTIPYLARLAEQVDGLEMRIVDSTVGRAVMNAHRTPDGRAATPTVVLLDEAYEEAGCFVERPVDLQTWFLASESLGQRERQRQKMAWYADDAGTTTLQQFVTLLEAAADGKRGC